MKIHAKQIDSGSLNSFVRTVTSGIVQDISLDVTDLQSDVLTLQDNYEFLSGQFTEIEENFVTYSGMQNTLISDIGDISVTLASLSGDMVGYNSELDALSGYSTSIYNTLDSEVDNLYNSIDSLNTTLVNYQLSVDQSLNNLSTSISSLNNQMSTFSTGRLLRNSNLSDLSNNNSGLRNLNIQKQYQYLKSNPDFNWLSGHDLTISARQSGYSHGVPVANGLQRISLPVLGFGKNIVNFPQATCGTTAWTQFILPNNWNKRRIYPKIYATTTGVGTSASVCWGITAEYFDNSMRLLGSGVNSTNHVVITDFYNDTSISGTLAVGPSTVSGFMMTGSASGDAGFDNLCVLRIQRLENASDTMAYNVFLLGVGIEYTITGTSPMWADDDI